MGNILCPFPGRVEQGQYTWQGVQYTLSGTRTDPHGNAIHGFTHQELWQCEVKRDSNRIECRYLLDKALFTERGYPHSLQVEVVYHLLDDDAGLEVHTRVSNVGDSVAPLGVGFHPFFTVLDRGLRDVDDMVVEVPARQMVEFDDKLKPTGRMVDVNDAGALNFSSEQKRKIGGTVIDNCYTDLIYTEDRATTTLSDPQSGARISVWQDRNFPYIQLYSLDKMGSDVYRRALAIEPESCCGFAFNVDGLGLQALNPGQVWTGTWGVSHAGLMLQ